MAVFSRFLKVDVPPSIKVDAAGGHDAFEIFFETDGEVPFPQVIFRCCGAQQILPLKNITASAPKRATTITPSTTETAATKTATANAATSTAANPTASGRPPTDVRGNWRYVASVPKDFLREHLGSAAEVQVQVEGCVRADWSNAGGHEWIKHFAVTALDRSATKRPRSSGSSGSLVSQMGAARTAATASPTTYEQVSKQTNGVKVYFGIHKHMHQPYYNTTDRAYWDGEKDNIFGSRAGNYTDFVPAAVVQYSGGGLPSAGLSSSWSGSLVEQLDRAGRDGLCGGRFAQWSSRLRDMREELTVLGHPRLDFSAFGFFHPLMPLIPDRDIVKQILWHRRMISETFGYSASKILFPPETAFHVRMIPALLEAGIEAVIYDSIHRYRACKDYPYAGIGEGLLPPNPAEQTNPPVHDWLQLQNIWAGSKISPSLLRPEYVEYVDPDGVRSKIIAIPAERYIGNEDARGGFGALLYPEVLGQVYNQIVATDTFDPAHPPFFLLHSDGDNHGGGADSYYKHNTSRLVEWLKEDSRFELISIRDYLERFPPDPNRVAHVEPGSWSGADNGDAQFMKWFSRYNESYSPDLNSWAVLTAFQNAVHAMEDVSSSQGQKTSAELEEATRLMLTAETSCYWYWTGQTVWDQQVTNAANRGFELLRARLEEVVRKKSDRTGPTIFAPWVTPENPGGQRWGQGCLLPAGRQATVHTFVFDVSGLERVEIVIRTARGETKVRMTDRGPYPSTTGASTTANYFTAELPVGAGDVRYFIEARDQRGNTARSALERVFLA